ncbi:unnamed protein product [Victoria cruziana]
MASNNTAMISKIASIAGSAMLVRSIVNVFFPRPFHHFLLSRVWHFFSRFSSRLSMLYEVAEVYLSTKISPSNTRLKVGKPDKEKGFLISMDMGEEIADVFGGTEKRISNSYGDSSTMETRYFELSFDKIHREKVLRSYFPYLLNRAKDIKEENTPVKIFTLSDRYRFGDTNGYWTSVVLDHPSTFETLAMEESQKAAIMDDLKKFVERRQLYRKVGRAWKRGYLLYGPRGTGKSSLIGAMANFLNFDIYGLELTDVRRNSDLRNLLMTTSNRSILVIEDIDCTKELKDRNGSGNDAIVHPRLGGFGENDLTLPGFLNFVDGLWSSCGYERIIIFTTNHKEKLDPALLRPGRMDMYVNMGYCSFSGFKVLASNYLGIHDHPLFGHVKDLMQRVQITPAEVGEEFMNLTVPLLPCRAKEELKEKQEDDEPVKVKENAGDGKEKGEKTEER